MRVCEVSNTRHKSLLIKPNFAKPNNVSPAVNPPYYNLPSISFCGQYMVTKDNFQTTVFENYFQLPPKCVPDQYQLDSAKSLYKGNSLLVTAPTGTGKTAIANYVMTKNMSDNKKTFYTTPLKALSNQKLNEFRKIYGDENVGLLTGDRKINPDAPIVIMTTEVYRNVCLSNYFGEPNKLLDNLGTVVFDEFHYLGDPDRGPVWEESIMFTPKDVQSLALSATVGNPTQIQNWISHFQTKPVDLVNVDPKERHVPLEFNAFQTESYYMEEDRLEKQTKKGHSGEDGTVNKPFDKDYETIITELNGQNKLPAIMFVFSKRYSRNLIDYFSSHGPVLTTLEEKKEIEKILNKYERANYLGESINTDALSRGYALHNAGMLPIQKQLIEELFQKKLVKVVISTETLAAGINMPARTVVISSYEKPSGDVKGKGNNGEDHSRRILTSNEFHQMAGRAGRRGIDTIGYVYTMNTDKKAEMLFDKLISSPNNNIESQLDPDFSFLASYYNYSPEEKQLKKIFAKSFRVSSSSSEDSSRKLEQLMQDTANKRNVMSVLGYLEDAPSNRHVTTDKGKMLSIIKGYDQLPLVESIDNKLYKDFTPAMLAMVMSSIANPMKKVDDESEPISYTFGDAINDLPKDAENIYSDMEENIKSYLKDLGHDYSEFRGLNEIYEFASNYKTPDADIEELQDKIDELNFNIDKLDKIQGEEEKKYWLSNVAHRLQRGEPVSIKTLELVQIDITKFKSEKKFDKKGNSFDKLIKTNQEQLKTKNENETKGLKIYLEKLAAMKYLDSSVEDGRNVISSTIKDYKRFIATHDKANMEAQLEALNRQYAELTVVKPLLQDVGGCIKMNETKSKLDNVQSEIKTVSATFAPLTSKAKEINELAKSRGVSRDTVTYSETIPQIVYKWMVLNSVNSNSTENWKYLVNAHYETKESVDEGSIFRGIAQTIDLLSQVIELSDKALELKTEEADIIYYQELKMNAQKSIELLMKDPVKFD